MFDTGPVARAPTMTSCTTANTEITDAQMRQRKVQIPKQKEKTKLKCMRKGTEKKKTSNDILLQEGVF